MKVFIDARMLSNSGVGRYTQNLIENMGSRKDFLLSVFLNKTDRKYLGEITGASLIYPILPVRIYSIKEQFLLYYYIKKANPDIVHFPNFNIALNCPYPFVVTIHDLIYINCPGAAPNNLARAYVRFMVKYACRKAEMIITDSEYSKKDISITAGIPENKITVIYPGVDKKYKPVNDAKKYLAKYNLPEKYILYVGNHEKRKNIPILIKAFAESKAADSYYLVLAGKKDKRRTEIFEAVEKYNLKSKIIFTDYIAEDDLPALYSGADLFVFLSSYEGFGLPPLEAMACGTPVICSNAASLPEVIGDAAIAVPSTDFTSVSEHIDNVLNNKVLRDEMREKGLRQSEKFSWDTTIQKTVEVYKKAVN